MREQLALRIFNFFRQIAGGMTDLFMGLMAEAEASALDATHVLDIVFRNYPADTAAPYMLCLRQLQWD